VCVPAVRLLFEWLLFECVSLLFVFWNCVILNWRDSGMHAQHGLKFS
jgi:hypothetical protein